VTAFAPCIAILLAGALARAQQPLPAAAPADERPGGGAAAPIAAPEPGAAGAVKIVDENYVLAAANREVVTVRDVLLEWRLERRRDADPARALPPKDDERRKYAKGIVIDRLWIAHARGLFPLYAEFVTPRMIDEEAKRRFGTLFDDPSVPADERQLMRVKAEVWIAMGVALTNDPEYKRCATARPSDVRRWYDRHPELHRVSTLVRMGRVLLGRENSRELYGEDSASLLPKVRQRAVELGSLEAAAAELAPGSYQPTKEYAVDREPDLREDVLAFARSAQPGELSPPFRGENSAMLFTVLARKEGRDVSFEEAAGDIKEKLENLRCNIRAQQYFVTRVLPEAFFGPPSLFDDEIEQFVPGYKERKAREQAREKR